MKGIAIIMKHVKQVLFALMLALLFCSFVAGCQTGLPKEGETKKTFVNPHRVEENACLAHHFTDGVCSRCAAVYTPSAGLDYTASEDGSGYLVSGIGECKDTQIIIPDTYEGLPVLGIAPRSFAGEREITYVNLPEGATMIGEWAFRECVNLRRLEIPATVSYIGREAFRGCIRVSEVCVPDGITVISNGTFRDCVNLISVNLPPTLTVIEMCAFEGCRLLPDITIPSSVTKIDAQAFDYCDSLAAVHYSGTVGD